MSKFLSNAAVQEFDAEVKHEYQAMGKLRNTVTLRTGVVGNSYKFARMTEGLANQKATQADVTPMDVGHSRQTALLDNWLASEYTDIFDQAEVNYDEKSELAKVIAKALSRREDQIIIDAIAGGTYSATPTGADQGFLIVNGGTNLTVDKLSTAALVGLTDRNVDEDDRTLITSAAGVQSLLKDPEVTSTDFTNMKALIGGTLEATTYMGFKIHIIGGRTEGGLAKAANIRDCYAYQKQAVGYAVSTIDMKTTIDWVAQKTAWLAIGMLKSGAILREARGVVKIQIDESA